MATLLSSKAYYPDATLAVVRVVTGLFMFYHGMEVFDESKMQEYNRWMVDLHFPLPGIAAYIGKGSELVGGALLLLGLLTRVGALLVLLTMLGVSFGIGQGRIFMEEQHPFMFVVVSFLYLFLGGGKFSLDRKLFDRES